MAGDYLRPTNDPYSTRRESNTIRLHEDILTVVFDCFDTARTTDRAACFHCSQFCSLWSGPVLRALWKNMGGSLLPLYWILLPDPDYVGSWGDRYDHPKQMDPYSQKVCLVSRWHALYYYSLTGLSKHP